MGVEGEWGRNDVANGLEMHLTFSLTSFQRLWDLRENDFMS